MTITFTHSSKSPFSEVHSGKTASLGPRSAWVDAHTIRPYGPRLCNGNFSCSVRAEGATALFLHLFNEQGESKGSLSFSPSGQNNVWVCEAQQVLPRDLYTLEVCRPDAKDSTSTNALECVDPWAWGLSSNRVFGDQTRRIRWLGGVSLPPELTPLSLASRPHFERQALRIMEMHLRGWTAHPSSAVEHPGTFAGAIEKLDYVKDLGINTIELMPITEYEECDYEGGEMTDRWGYMPVHYFSPMGRYTAASRSCSALTHPHEIMVEVRRFTDAVHARGMQLIVDMVLNHTGEGNEYGRPVSLRALQPSSFIYSNGFHTNYSECGNTLNAHSPHLATLFRAALRFWVEHLGVDGFRLDLAAILLMDEEARHLECSSFFEMIAQDEVLREVLWVAEPWGPYVYRLGHFSYLESRLGLKFIEWNDQYRKAHRRFLAGDGTARGELAHHLVGSLDRFEHDFQSLRYVTCHDGLCLIDLVATTSSDADERERIWMNHLALLLGVSPGPVMLFGEDAVGGSRGGDPNPWNKDEPNHVDWTDLDQAPKRSAFVGSLLQWRASHPVFQSRAGSAQSVCWHGLQPHEPNWEDHGLPLIVEFQAEQHVLAAINPHNWSHHWTLPNPPPGQQWRHVCNTGDVSLHTIPEQDLRPLQVQGQPILIGANSVVVLESVRTATSDGGDRDDSISNRSNCPPPR